jgi:glycosyltransferase involved in cell wall biosynthesis
VTETKKRKILYLSDHSKLNTGFGRNAKTVLSYLYSTGKYEIVEFCCSPYTYRDEKLKALPWKAYGAMPEERWVLSELSQNEGLEAMVKYGSFYIDDIVKQEKPDFFLGVNDFWAFTDFYDKDWWNKINCALWVTMDSLPLYEDAVNNAHKIKNFWVWSKFAESEFKRLGHDHIKTIPGAFDVSCFKPLDKKKELKASHNIEEDCKVFGFVFRNQPRKLVGTLIEGFSIFKEKNPTTNAKLLLHTSWSDGQKSCWDIPAFIKEYKINKEDVLATHVCEACRKYVIKPFEKDISSCPKCGRQNSLTTTKPNVGVSEEKMNEIYNIMDFYIHPVTSGGLEMPLVESLLAGTPIATSNYSCGEEFCEQEFVTTIKHNEYREAFSQFRKAQPSPEDIAGIIGKVSSGDYNLDYLSFEGRRWAESRFNINNICGQIEKWLDDSPLPEYDFDIGHKKYNDTYEFIDIGTDEEWTENLIKGIFKMEDKETVMKITKKLSNGTTRKEIYDLSISKANIHNRKIESNLLSSYIPEKEKGLLCFIAPFSIDEKIVCIEYLKSVCRNEKIALVCDKTDEDIFAECGNFYTIPKSEKSCSPDWLITMKNKSGEKIFRKIIYKNGNSFQETE